MVALFNKPQARPFGVRLLAPGGAGGERSKVLDNRRGGFRVVPRWQNGLDDAAAARALEKWRHDNGADGARRRLILSRPVNPPHAVGEHFQGPLRLLLKFGGIQRRLRRTSLSDF